MSNFPYIGCRISLISKHGLRYEGVLFSIHAESHEICLNSVRCFGTEGRRAKDGLAEVPAAADVFEYIRFRGSDIQDLTVCDSPTPAQVPADPAIVSSQAPPVPAPAPVQTAPSVGCLLYTSDAADEEDSVDLGGRRIIKKKKKKKKSKKT
eukprot:TRINITY_DN1505_c0_g1_i4.p1 TRINITY_DN1505_c0_g1~~TRINITY_DN1505_c0_g1_i4.p1  ORF type:complete len:151 (-),score=39.45 TRINITY_DN1505_c0_g1_i4:99-551(-)